MSFFGCYFETVEIDKLYSQLIERIQQDFYMVPRKINTTKEKQDEYVNKVIDFVCNFCGINKEEIATIRKETEVAFCRYIIYYILKKHSKMDLSSRIIAGYFSRKTSTVIHALRKTDELLETHKEFTKQLRQCEYAFLERHGI